MGKIKDALTGNKPKGDKPTQAEINKATLEAFKAKYPAFANMFDGGEGEAKARAEFGGTNRGQKGADLYELLLDVAQHPKNYDLTTAEGIKAFDALVSNTSYVLSTIDAQRTFDFQSVTQKAETVKLKRQEIAFDYGELGLTGEQVDQIATMAARQGYAKDSLSLQYLVYQTAGKGAAGAATVKGSNSAEVLKQIAKNYNYSPDNIDAKIQAILTGTPGTDGVVPTADSFTKEARMQAIGMYPNLKDQLDAGSTLADIFGTYRQHAAKILSKPQDQIDFNNPLYSVVFGNTETGQMGLDTFDRLVRTDKRYGYQFTDQANQDVKNVGLMLASAWGQVG